MGAALFPLGAGAPFMSSKKAKKKKKPPPQKKPHIPRTWNKYSLFGFLPSTGVSASRVSSLSLTYKLSEDSNSVFMQLYILQNVLHILILG